MLLLIQKTILLLLQGTVIDLLSVTNSSVPKLPDFVFRNLRVLSLRMRGCSQRDVGHNAFRGLENTLRSLDLGANELRHAPVMPLRQLRMLSTLDLGGNRISLVPDNAFVTLRLKTLRLAGNSDVTLAPHSLRGQESSLKNLNLAGCGLRELPQAVRGLKGLAFLDLAQNNLRSDSLFSTKQKNCTDVETREKNRTSNYWINNKMSFIF